jgi:hypothetical protein
MRERGDEIRQTGDREALGKTDAHGAANRVLGRVVAEMGKGIEDEPGLAEERVSCMGRAHASPVQLKNRRGELRLQLPQAER